MYHRDRRVESVLRVIRYTVAAGALILLASSVMRAQEASATPSTQSLREARRLEMESRQRALWNLEKEARKHARDKRPPAERLAYQQAKEDFEVLQLTNYTLSETAGASTSLDYDQISKAAAEVRKRAGRLKASLVLPEAEKDEKQKQSAGAWTLEELKSAIADLDTLVKHFTTNPMFQQPDVVDAQQSMQARRDLEGIIRLSEQIKRSAEALSKAAAK